jgi:hypothetical protein
MQMDRPSVVDQARRATHKRNRTAMLLGGIMGAFVPAASYLLVHREVAERPTLWCLVAGALVFSAPSVYAFGCSAFRSKAKALGFAVLVEGTMTFSGNYWLALAALAMLAAVNGVETGMNLAVEQRETKPETPRRRAAPKAAQRGPWMAEAR